MEILEESKKSEKAENTEKPEKAETSRNNFIIFRANSLESVPISEEDKAKIKNEKDDEIKSNINTQKRYSTKYVFHETLFVIRGEKRRVTITNMNELNINRFEHLQNDVLRRRTFAGGESNF